MRVRLGVLVLAAVVVSLVPAPAGAATRTLTLRSQAFTLGGFAVAKPKVRVPNTGRTGYLVGMRARLVDVRGRPVPIQRVMLHHIVFLNDARRGRLKRSTCAGRNGEPFWGTGEERQPLILPPGYGYRTRSDDRWRMQLMLMSHSLRRQRVRVEYRVKVVTGRRMQRVKPLWLRANGCTLHPSYDISGETAPGVRHRRASTFKVPVSGRIVAASAHLHAGAHSVTVSQPRCGDRHLVRHLPLWGLDEDPVYAVKPILHEPGPIATGHYLSQTGIPVRRGEPLKVTGLYEGDHPRPGVMAISHVYVAIDRKAPRGCGRLPTDRRILWTRRDGVLARAPTRIPLTGANADGNLFEVTRPPGPLRFSARPAATVSTRGVRFSPANLSIPRNGSVTWRYDDVVEHNVLLAEGPRNVVAPTRRRGAYTKRFPTPGEYKLFCYLHPLTMHQRIKVRD